MLLYRDNFDSLYDDTHFLALVFIYKKKRYRANLGQKTESKMKCSQETKGQDQVIINDMYKWNCSEHWQTAVVSSVALVLFCGGVVTSIKESVFTHVCVLVGLSAGFNKNYWTDFCQTWMEDEPQPRTDPLTFGADPDRGTDPELCLTLWDVLVFLGT